MKPLLVPDDLHCHDPSILMIHTPHDLPKAALPKHINDLVPIRQMIAKNDIVVASLVVVPEVIARRAARSTTGLLVRSQRSLRRTTRPVQTPDDLPRCFRARKEDAVLLVINNLASLEDIQS